MHTFLRKCNKGVASCNCAVAIKVDDNVVLFDRCGARAGAGGNQPMTLQIFKNTDIHPGLRIQQYHGGTKYKVRLPSVFRSITVLFVCL